LQNEANVVILRAAMAARLTPEQLDTLSLDRDEKESFAGFQNRNHPAPTGTP
jgi:hypothetical protein